MALRLPEILVHRPPTPFPETKGRSRWYENPLLRIGLGLATIGAGAGLAYQLFFSPDRGAQSAPITSNAPITDTLKPPANTSPAVSVNVPPPVEATPSASPPPEPPNQPDSEHKDVFAGGPLPQEYLQQLTSFEATTGVRSLHLLRNKPTAESTKPLNIPVYAFTDGEAKVSRIGPPNAYAYNVIVTTDGVQFQYMFLGKPEGDPNLPRRIKRGDLLGVIQQVIPSSLVPPELVAGQKEDLLGISVRKNVEKPLANDYLDPQTYIPKVK